MKKEKKDIYYQIVGAKELAEIIGISDRRIRKLSEKHTIRWIENDPAYQYHLGEAVNDYIEYLRMDIAKKNNSNLDDLNERKMLADVLRAEKDVMIKQNHAELTALQLEEYRGNLHDSQDVQDAITEVVMTAKQGIVSLHGKLGIKIASKLGADPAVCIDMVREAEDEILTELYEHQYSEKFFKSKLRQRQLEEEIERYDHAES